MIYLFEGNHAMIYGFDYLRDVLDVRHRIPLFDDLEFRQIGLDEVRHADLMDVVGVVRHVKQLLPPL